MSLSENWICREVPAVFLSSPNPDPLRMLAGSPMGTMLNRLKNSERNCRSTRSAPLLRWPTGVSLVRAEAEAPARAEDALLRAGAASNVNWNGEKVGRVVLPFAEVILANATGRGEI